MSIIGGIFEWLKLHWVELGVALWLIEQGMRAVSELTPWQWDDNIVKVVSKILKSIFPKRNV